MTVIFVLIIPQQQFCLIRLHEIAPVVYTCTVLLYILGNFTF